ncbi:protein-methionine-sulfoxide reductase catalytic subunit MsrP [Pleionea sp. CnH1-48]|uniref:protein-methionine-sulfoxide reductase catalytic subunit MsrP n=1 Tax=Pleionea sp. CnH1-48 TaxID=2954494 RepID=UPI002096888E|nr:protein-methionine-sulfoxide reductase catalytic subunit MsrP [Pleionea sp. CnH1-48]MCO7225297.1 protein-methionine-sulfoxide reductase catalytic subunit MsrP [Pleionea sp. CnH1-48]
MLIKNTRSKPDFNCPEYEITDESAFINRRQLIKGMAASGALSSLPILAGKASPYSTSEQKTSEYSITHYNNFYEFSLSKEEPAKKAKNFVTNNWQVAVEGEVESPGVYDFEDILKWVQQEERIYRLRCVEAWSMVVPWYGFELRQLIKRLKPTSKAKYVQFETLYDPERMPGQRRGVFNFSSLDWPYVEGLRMDEAMNPLTLMVTGLYGKNIPPQNGAPLRLIVPWKYGFKSIKSIVKIKFVEKQPVNTWQKTAPKEYGFYANVNPDVPHPRWSQAKERRILSESLFSGTRRIKTEFLNGYAEHVAHLYKGMDLSRHF